MMVGGSLEYKLNGQQAETEKKATLWDFLVSAYSAAKATKLALVTATSGASLGTIASAYALTYLGLKTAGAAIKYIFNIIKNPAEYLSLKKFSDETYATIKDYNPFGRYRRSTFLGTTLAATTHVTGF